MRFPVSAICMIAIGGLCMFLYIVFNYVFNSPKGLKNLLWSSANKTMGSGPQLTQFNELMPQLTQGFGIACVLCFGMAIVIFLFDAFGQPREPMG